MQKLENKILQKFLERFIDSLKYEKEYDYNNRLDIPFIISTLYQSFKNNPSDYKDFIIDLIKLS